MEEKRVLNKGVEYLIIETKDKKELAKISYTNNDEEITVANDMVLRIKFS